VSFIVEVANIASLNDLIAVNADTLEELGIDSGILQVTQPRTYFGHVVRVHNVCLNHASLCMRVLAVTDDKEELN